MLLGLSGIISMSKIAFVSDIHGNYPALSAVLNDCRQRGISTIYCLGDLVGYYSQINEVIDTLRDLNIPCVMGNHDYAMANNNGVIDRSKTCTNVLTKQLSYITPSNLEFVKNLPDQKIIDYNGQQVFCVHGGLNDHIDEYLGELNDEYFAALPENVAYVVTAHNHKAMVADFKNVKYANCGSIGQPRDHDPRASYAILEDNEFKIVRVDYNIDETVNKMKENGFPDYIAAVLYKGYRIGE